jgi:putative colanic acid biosynthesis acetyltransferase WcaF
MNDPSTSDLVKRRIKSPFSVQSKMARFAWGAAWLFLFRPSPRALHSWRRGLLRMFGANVAATAKIYPGVKIWAPWNLRIGEVVGIADGVTLYSQAAIILEDHVTVSQEAYLCTGSHDYRSASFPLWTAPIHVKRNVWIAARAFIHPGTTISEDAVVGACAVVTDDVPAGAIVSGNPAVIRKFRNEYN